MVRRGMTLVEVLVVAAMVPLVLGASFVLAKQSEQAWMLTSQRLSSIADAQRALDRAVNELRMGSASSLVCDDKSISVEVNGVPIQYSLTAQNMLTRTVGGVSTDIAGNLLAFSPTCRSDGLVDLRVTARVTAVTGQSMQTLDSWVFVQNP